MAWMRALWPHWKTCMEAAKQNPSPAKFALICLRMSDATFRKLITSRKLEWMFRRPRNEDCRLREDISRHATDDVGQPLYEVYVEMKALPQLASTDLPDFSA